MDIKAQNMYSELQSLASQATTGMGEMQTAQANPSATNFADMLGKAINTVNSMQLEAKDKINTFEMGGDISLAEVMIAKQKSGVAFEATIQVRNKVLEAYRQVMNMPV